MKAIISVIGKDKIGIIAGITSELEKFQINILDITQTIMEEYFTMITLVDISKMNAPFDKVKQALKEKGKELGVEVNIQREEIFNSMHKL